MSGSVAEERIRAKAEAMLRQLWPDARIIHELVLIQGGERIDLAAVRPDMLIVIEIKSERDVLTRLPKQAEAAMRVADLFGVCIAEKHAGKVARSYETPDDRYRLPYDAELLIETDDGFHAPYSPFDLGWLGNRREPRLCNPADRLEMLWAEELKLVSRAPKLSRQPAKRLVCETMTGRQIREAVCATLRARHFPRADPPILSDLFPVMSVESIAPLRAAA